MGKFIVKSAIFVLSCVALVFVVEYIYYHYGNWRKNIEGWEVYTAIQNSKTKQGKKKLLIGDSVGMQLFPCNENNDSVALCTCNQAVTMAGFYMLMDNYLDSNKECLPEEVILLVTPLTLRNNIDEFTYHYFLKPFRFVEYRDKYTNLLISRLQNIPMWWTASFPFIRTSMYMERYIPQEEVSTLLSPLALEYLQKMNDLAKANGIEFKIRSASVKDILRNDIESKWGAILDYPDLLQEYFVRLDYMQDSCYEDKVHFKKEVLQNIEKDYLLE